MPAIPQVVRRHPLVITLVVLVALPLLVFTLWAGITLNYTYSTGNRAGFLQKISKRGWLCKTWEGELNSARSPVRSRKNSSSRRTPIRSPCCSRK